MASNIFAYSWLLFTAPGLVTSWKLHRKNNKSVTVPQKYVLPLGFVMVFITAFLSSFSSGEKRKRVKIDKCVHLILISSSKACENVVVNLHLIEIWLDPASSPGKDVSTFLPKPTWKQWKLMLWGEPDQQETTKQLLSQQCVKCREQIKSVYIVAVF